MNQLISRQVFDIDDSPSVGSALKAFKSEKDAFKAGQWARAISGNEDAAKWCADQGIRVKVAGEGTGSAGGYTVPFEVSTAIIALRERYGVFRRNAQLVPMSTEITTVPRKTAAATGYWIVENTTVTQSTPALGNVALDAKKLAALITTSSELEEDGVGFGDWFANELAYGLAKAEDDAGFTGDGTSTYGGIVGLCPQILAVAGASKVVAASGHDTWAEIDGTDLANLLTKLPGYALPGAKWFISAAGFALLFCRLAATSGGFVSSVVNGRNVLSFMGFPVEITPSLPTTAGDLSGSVMFLFGDLSLAATLGDRRTLTVARSEHRYFDTDTIAFKGRERVDLVCHGIGDATTAGPIVALVGE